MNLTISSSGVSVQDLTKLRKTNVKVPATCGELMQGFLDDRDFLINCPMNRFAHFQIGLSEGQGVYLRSSENLTKVKDAVSKALDRLAYGDKAAYIDPLELIPRGKGLASSTAEITAVVAATSYLLSGSYWHQDLCTRILMEIDKSTDAVYCEGITMCDHLAGQVFMQFRRVPSLSFVIVDAGSEVDTAFFDRAKARRNALNHEDRLRSALASMIYGLQHNKPSFVAKAATESALINQHILEKPCLTELISGTKEWGSLGVNCAHTGSVLGVLFDPLQCNSDQLLERVCTLVGKDKVIGRYDLISGGLY